MDITETELSELQQSLPISASLNSLVLEQAKSLYYQGKIKDSEWENNKVKSTMQGCIYLSCLLSSQNFNFSQLFDDISQLHSFMIRLKEILKQLAMPLQVSTTASRLIKNYAISLMNYKKLEELFDKFAITCSYEHSSMIFQTIWLLFIIARKEKYNGTEDLSECGCLIISVLDLFTRNLPESISHCLQVSPLIYLTGSFRTIPSHVQPFIAKASELLSDLTLQEVVKSPLSAALALAKISDLISSLSEKYGNVLDPDDLDERFIRNSVCNNNLLLTPVVRRTISVSATRGKVLNWDENISLSLTTRLNDVLKPASTSFQAETPMTSAMECNSWVNKLLEDFTVNTITRVCGEHWEEIAKRTEELKSEFSTFVNRRRNLISPQKIEDIGKLYYTTLENLLKIEKNKGGTCTTILQNDKFHRALFACCAETILYIVNISCVSFEEILNFHNIVAFDFWKNINSFIQFDIKMPLQVKKHFKDIEERIVTRDGWEENNPVAQAISRITSESFAGELSHPSFGQFFKRVLSYSANRITEICNSVKLAPGLQEEVWAAFKFFLSEKTEFLISRHLDQIILCTIYGVCKNSKVGISFKLLFEQHNSLYQTDSDLFTNVRLSDGRTGDVIKFYNEIYIAAMKDFLMKKAPVALPRISSLNPTSPLKANVQMFQVPQSPFMTPKTKRLWAFGENISQTLQGINSMIQTTARKINFDLPIKREREEDQT